MPTRPSYQICINFAPALAELGLAQPRLFYFLIIVFCWFFFVYFWLLVHYFATCYRFITSRLVIGWALLCLAPACYIELPFFIRMKLMQFINAMCIFQHYIGHKWLEYDPSQKFFLKLCIDSYHKNMKIDFTSFDLCQLKSHIVTDIIPSIYSFTNRVFMPSYSIFDRRYIITFIASLFNFYNTILSPSETNRI